MGKYVANRFIKKMILSDRKVKNGKILILGFTFKENCPDTRNTKVIHIYNELKEYTNNIVICDPLADRDAVRREYGIDIVMVLMVRMVLMVPLVKTVLMVKTVRMVKVSPQ